jgi:iron complex outermembrane recepter protein
MKKILTLLTIALTTLSFAGNAQVTGGKVTGKVIDGNTKTIEAASITLHKASDSTVAKMSVANKEGNYQFENVVEGNYFVSISAVGHSKGFSDKFTVDAAHAAIEVKTIELVPVSKNLGAVTITTKRPLIEQRIDRTIVNVDASVSNVGATALEVLEKSPGISVDKDGNVSLKGKQGVQVYIDGRPSYLSGADLANLLRNMNANQLEQIEIMTNPPAKYDAAGNSGVINIKTKKNKQFGYNGSISATYGQGRYPKTNESVNFNYRKNKVNLFANAGYSYRQNFNDINIQRKFIEANTKELKSYFEQESKMKDIDKSLNAKLGLDFYATKKTTLGFVVSGFNSPEKDRSTSDVNIFDNAHILSSITKATTKSDRTWKNIGANLNFRHVFDSTGREITADADYLSYNSTNTQDLINKYYGTNGQPTFRPDTLLGNLPQDIKIYSAKIDYVHPLKKGAKVEFGVKTSFVKTDNDARYDSLQNNLRVLDRGRSNHFIYNENVNAAYINFSKEFSKKFSGQFGFRVENNTAKGHSTGLKLKDNVWIPFDSSFRRNNTQPFPTVFLQYNANEKNTFGLNYGRRIERPDYADLNPFILFLDRYTFEQGNPNLKPQFAHNIELSHTYKGFLTTTLNYTKTTDIISDVLEQNTDQNETFVRKSNIANQRQYGISVSAGIPVKKWWNANLYANVFNNKFNGIVGKDYIEVAATTGQFNISNQFEFAKTWSAELSGFYTTPLIWGVFKIDGFGSVNMGISKKIMKGKGSVRFNVRDVLNSNNQNGTSKYSNIDAAFQQQRDSRVVTLGFTYRFNKGKAANTPKRQTGGASEEQNRVKTGNNN